MSVSVSKNVFLTVFGSDRFIAAVTIFVAACYVARIVYNLFWHPLSSYPGPRFNAATNIPYNFHVLRGNSARALCKLHEKYGDVVRYSPNSLSYICPESWNEIYGPYKNKKHMEMDPKIFGGNVTVTGALQITNAIDDDHKRMRARFMQALSSRAITQQEPVLQSYTKLFIDKIEAEMDRTGGIVDIAKWFSLVTFDVISDLAFGEPFGNLKNGQLHSWAAVIFGAFKVLSILRVVREIPGLTTAGNWITVLLPKRLKQMWFDHFNYAFDLVEERLQNPKSRKDFVYYLVDGLDVDMTRDEIKECAAQMVMAGSEPTATFLAGLSYFLSSNQDSYCRVRDEVRTSFDTADQITVASVAKLQYFERVVREGFRLFPPAPDIFPRIIPDGGETICGKWLPAGTQVGIAALAACYSKSNFDKPDKFDPDRWLEYDGQPLAPTMKASQPFGQGHRACVGKNLAIAEIRLLLANLLWNFDLELAVGQEQWLKRCRTYLGWEKPPLMIQLRARQSNDM